MSKSRLTNVEKHAIENMHNQGTSAKEIATELGRSVSCVENYINKLPGTELQAVDPEPTPAPAPKKKVFVTPEVRQKAYKMLRNANVSSRDADDMLDAAERKLIGKIKDPKDLYNIALRSITTKNLMIRETSGGRSGVAIMTKTASERGDSTRDKRQKYVGRSRGAIWDCKTQRMADDNGEEQK